MFTDTHSHIHFPHEFPDVEQVLERASRQEVTRQIIVGCTPKDSYQALLFVKNHPDRNLWSSLGVHPHNADLFNDQVLSRFEELLRKEEKLKALGEMGLDYFRNLQPRELQIKTFRSQLILAKKLDIPAIIHVREAWEDAFQILEEIQNHKVILHCFSGNREQAELCWNRGYHTSFSGIITYPKNNDLREIVQAAPLDKILLETDCPYLTPQKYRGRRNEPAYMIETAQEVARLKELDIEKIAEMTTQNACTLFNIS